MPWKHNGVTIKEGSLGQMALINTLIIGQVLGQTKKKRFWFSLGRCTCK